ncbi:MFS transporter [Streptomyces sp. NPDC047017]|uniref:MFS transporter n=1 Tax=Streptomyces sp. NPDC047017 TaxID=3155024 RepID=UPI0034103127
MSVDQGIRSASLGSEEAAEPGMDKAALIRMLIVVSGMFMITLDFFGVNVAIPSLRVDLDAGSAAIEFIVSGFSLAYAAGMVTAGRLGDLYGRRRVFALGMAFFTLASLAAGLAPTPGVLIVARVVQGIGAAVMTPQMLAILNTSFSGVQRVRAFTAFALSMGISATFGQLIGGVLIHADIAGIGWRAIFLVNVPIGALSLLLMRKYVPESHGTGRTGLDLIGAALGSCGLLAVVLSLVEGREQGWPAWSWVVLASSVPLLAVFALRQNRLERTDRAPLISLSLFRERAFSVGILIILGFFAAMASFMFVLALYLQDGHGASPLNSGLIFGALGIGYVPAAFAARLGKQVLTLGALVVAAGYGVMIVAAAATGVSGSVYWIMPGLCVAGVGMALFANPVTPTVLAGVEPDHAAAAAGVLSTAQEGGNALGVAAIGVVFFGVLGHGGRGAYADAFGWSVALLAAFTVAVAVLVQALPEPAARN